MRYASLFAYHFIYFITTGMSTFVPKFYGEIGLSDSRIGLLTSVPTLIALLVAPALASLTDRVSRKRYMLSAMLLFVAGSCLAVARATSFLPLLAVVSVYTVFSTAAQPLATTIALEYTRETHQAYGPIRLLGTVGYQAGALLVGAILSQSLNNLYPLMGAVVLVALATTFAMPNVEGHQHKRERIPLTKLFSDRHVRWLYILIFLITITSQFYISFFSKHLGDLGMDNATVSWITLLSVLAELPFLYFGDRIARWTNIWNWLLIGAIANGVRWLGLALSRSALAIILFQIPGVTVLACFEFFPALYLARRVSPELSGAAQSVLTLTTFGAAKIVGSLLGGVICEYTGIPALMAFNGAALLVGSIAIYRFTRGLIRDDTVRSLG